eukprot:TRINITY_DN6911_c0_g1_i1.p1 TRINITY_DN6911_c0_g1~~TRINITY_DN6911_c0_g1_i1.p1  ORF type:complete len:239 (-),score=63.48 TRINITY_DN6911_c0_g1_i1:129-845(-)
MSSLTSLQPPAPGVRETISDSGDKLGELVNQLDKVKMVNGDVEEENSSTGPGRYIKHPLQNAWTLWFFKNDKSRTWEENQRPIITVTTVEDFWSLYNHVEVASRLPVGADYSLFKEGIFPDWEDPRNQEGGRWIISLDKKTKQHLLDTYWLEILFYLIGEHADQHAYQVNGAVVNIRARTDKLAVWLADASQSESIMKIGRELKERLDITGNNMIGFNVHNEEKTQIRSNNAKQRFQL